MVRVRTVLRVVGLGLVAAVVLALVLTIVTENDPTAPRWLSPVWLAALAVVGAGALVATRGVSSRSR